MHTVDIRMEKLAGRAEEKNRTLTCDWHSTTLTRKPMWQTTHWAPEAGL